MPEAVETRSNVTRTLYTISELAQEFDVTTRALRFYESMGLLSPRRQGQKRFYDRRDRTRLKLTLRGKRLGMTLAEIREVFDLYDSALGEAGQLERYVDILQEKRAKLARQRQDLDDALVELDESERRCRTILEEKRARQAARGA